MVVKGFSFKSISKDDIVEAVKKLLSNNTAISNDITISIIKNFATCYCEKLASIFNDCLKENKFPNLMKIAEISPVFKKLDNTSKDNYRPISTLSNFTKLLKASFLRNSVGTCKTHFQNISRVFGKIITRTILS